MLAIILSSLCVKQLLQECLSLLLSPFTPDKTEAQERQGAEVIIPALGRVRQEDCEFEGILGYRVRLYLKQQNKNKLNKKNN